MCVAPGSPRNAHNLRTLQMQLAKCLHLLLAPSTYYPVLGTMTDTEYAGNVVVKLLPDDAAKAAAGCGVAAALVMRNTFAVEKTAEAFTVNPTCTSLVDLLIATTTTRSSTFVSVLAYIETLETSLLTARTEVAPNAAPAPS